MKPNIGIADRILRLIIGVILLILGWWETSWILLALALFCFYEALASWCLFYQLIGRNTCSIDSKKK